MSDTYRTIAAPAQGLYKEKGSKFTAYAFAVQSDDEVKQHVNWAKREFYDARHHCYAYRIGKNGVLFRANDDGEPSGTAGKPILGQLLSADLVNVLVVVVRYFGGTLLGTSGLITAYKAAAANAITNAHIEERTWNTEITATFPYGSVNGVMKVVKDEQLQIVAQEFSNAACRITLSVRESKASSVRKKLEEVERLTSTI